MTFKYRNLLKKSECIAEKEQLKASSTVIIQPVWELQYYNTVKYWNEDYPDLYIVIPSIPLVLKMLKTDGIDYTLVYPEEQLKDEYEERFKNRGNTIEFMEVFIDRWDLWIQKSQQDRGGQHIVLKSKQYLIDVIKIDSTCKDSHLKLIGHFQSQLLKGIHLG